MENYRLPTNGAEVIAEILEDVAFEKRGAPENQNLVGRRNSLALQRQSTANGSTRLKDAVVYGYIMQRHALQEKVIFDPESTFRP